MNSPHHFPYPCVDIAYLDNGWFDDFCLLRTAVEEGLI